MNAPGSPIALVGTIALFAAYILAAWCVAAGIAGNARKNRRLVSSAVYGLFGFGAMIALASTLLIYAFVTHDYSIRYVAATSDTSMSTWYKVTAFWGGLDGSLLFWVLVLSLFSMVAIAVNHRRHRDMIGFVVATIMVVQVFFLSLLIFTKNPFSTFLTTPPTDGQGLNPLLQNYWMVIHPPSLYTGFVAATIPFAFGIGALASGRLDDMWLGSVRVWMLICFFFLSLGLILGGRWAYEELGWGGYWAWDPVENAGFMPWFTATAFLHSAIIQEQRGMMKKWNLSLVILTFFLTIFGTFMTRSGAVQSVHAFGEDNVLALQFIVFMALILVVSVGLLVYRSNKLASQSVFDSFYSREFAFLLNNWILLGCAFFVLFATMFPTISEALDGARVSVGIEFFNRWMTPFGLVLLLLAGAAPLLAWRKTTRERLYNQFLFPALLAAATIGALVIFMPQTTKSTAMFSDTIQLPVSLINFGFCAFVFGSITQEFVRGVMVRRRQTGSDPISSLFGLVLTKRRKYGGYIVHLGIAVLFIGFAGKAYDRMVDRTIAKPIHGVIDNAMIPEGTAVTPEALSLLNTSTRAMLRDDVGLADDLAANVIAARSARLDGATLRRVVGFGGAALATVESYARSPHHVILRAPLGKRMTVNAARDTMIAHGVDPQRINVKVDGPTVVATAAYQLDFEIQGRLRKNFAELAEVPIESVELFAQPAAWFEFSDYRFVYEALIHTSDDHKDAVTAQVGIWKDGERIATVYPGKWDYHKGEGQATTEVAIKVRFTEDVYVVLTGYDLDNELANFRVYVNPLISWVWIGFLVLAFGTFICLIPQGVVDRISSRPTSRIGRAADVGLFVALIFGVLALLATQAGAAPTEHVPAGQGMGQAGGGFAAMNRPANATDGKAMKELLCPCGCARQTLHDCDCKSAADLRESVQTILSDYDLNDAKQRAAGYDKVLAFFVKDYGERVLANPTSKVSWLLPSLAIVGGLGLLFVVGRRWVVASAGRPGSIATATDPAAPTASPSSPLADDAYADKLDDELAETD
ncbi:MAG: cytochrome c biogenesis protein CcsA [Proteobacteria bacterium]|nr:cytochrome c biogenesis protein CcsA [Pseudomonadota bacterium]